MIRKQEERKVNLDEGVYEELNFAIHYVFPF
jgi:hypothetical protein